MLYSNARWSNGRNIMEKCKIFITHFCVTVITMCSVCKLKFTYAIILMLAKQRDQSVYIVNIGSKVVNLLYLLDEGNKSSLY